MLWEKGNRRFFTDPEVIQNQVEPFGSLALFLKKWFKKALAASEAADAGVVEGGCVLQLNTALGAHFNAQHTLGP